MRTHLLILADIDFISLSLSLFANTQVCSAESAISAATGAGASRLKADAGSLESSLHQRYRMRTVEEYIGDTCSAAAAINDKLEHHGTQYPSYDCK